jgi:citrate lyase subunit beta/citryl-CoA lyase
MSSLRPRRSALYMPAANERALEKAKGISTDAIIFDLEDAVSPDSIDVARAQAVAAVNSGEYGKRELTIRCNALATPWGHADVAAAAKACVSAVVIPNQILASSVRPAPTSPPRPDATLAPCLATTTSRSCGPPPGP